jgi:hypothetical protein
MVAVVAVVAVVEAAVVVAVALAAARVGGIFKKLATVVAMDSIDFPEIPRFIFILEISSCFSLRTCKADIPGGRVVI